MKASIIATILGAAVFVSADEPAAGAAPSGTKSCPPAGEYDSKGRYSCNPAHEYPNGQKCATIDGCYFLTDADGKPIVSKPTQSATTCPRAGETDSKGRYSCNPAHEYPEGQKCVEVDGCYFLGDASKSKTMSAHPTQTGSVCPAPGSTDKLGRYSCNPAHQYPEGQKCVSIDGCFYLCDTNGKPIHNMPTGHPVITGGASSLQAAGALAVAAFGALL